MNKCNTDLETKGILSRLLCIKMSLRDVLYITYALPAKMIQPLVPAALSLATLNRDTAFVSLVVLRSTRVRLSLFPLVRFAYNQFNIRTYVIDPLTGRPGVYFILSGVNSRMIALATNSIGIPWQFINLVINMNSLDAPLSLSVYGTWEGLFSVKTQVTSNPPVTPSFFKNMKSAVDFLIRPLIGFSGDSHSLVRFTIQHPEVQPESGTLIELDCPLFQRLVAIGDPKHPHSVFYLPAADFSIFLPPKRIKKNGRKQDVGY
jgi:hypothetical protein